MKGIYLNRMRVIHNTCEYINKLLHTSNKKKDEIYTIVDVSLRCAMR